MLGFSAVEALDSSLKPVTKRVYRVMICYKLPELVW